MFISLQYLTLHSPREKQEITTAQTTLLYLRSLKKAQILQLKVCPIKFILYIWAPAGETSSLVVIITTMHVYTFQLLHILKHSRRNIVLWRWFTA